MKKICVIGTVGFGEETSSGQIIRTRILVDSLREKYGASNTYLINTSNYKKRAFAIIRKTISSLWNCNVYIVILSGNGRKVFFPILCIFKKFFGKIILNNIIGGDYANSIKRNLKYIKWSNTFDVNWVQMASMKREIEKLGIKNVEVLPNSKPLHIVKKNNENISNDGIFHFCTFSRVSKQKGIEIAIDTIETINKENGSIIADLTIYGKPDDEYQSIFEKKMQSVTEAIHYGGIIEYNKATEILSKYYCLLFPTTFYGEGFPGTILDAYASGLPVIASDWKYNSELIKTGETGYLYNYKDPNELKKRVMEAITKSEEVMRMRENCVKEAEKYVPENVMPIIFDKINQKNK